MKSLYKLAFECFKLDKYNNHIMMNIYGIIYSKINRLMKTKLMINVIKPFKKNLVIKIYESQRKYMRSFEKTIPYCLKTIFKLSIYVMLLCTSSKKYKNLNIIIKLTFKNFCKNKMYKNIDSSIKDHFLELYNLHFLYDYSHCDFDYENIYDCFFNGLLKTYLNEEYVKKDYYIKID